MKTWQVVSVYNNALRKWSDASLVVGENHKEATRAVARPPSDTGRPWDWSLINAWFDDAKFCTLVLYFFLEPTILLTDLLAEAIRPTVASLALRACVELAQVHGPSVGILQLRPFGVTAGCYSPNIGWWPSVQESNVQDRMPIYAAPHFCQKKYEKTICSLTLPAQRFCLRSMSKSCLPTFSKVACVGVIQTTTSRLSL